MKSIQTIRDLAFGNGTRKRGFELGTSKDPDKAVLLASEFEPDFKKLGVELVEGVTESEMVTALRNPLQLVFVDPNAVVDENENVEGSDEDDGEVVELGPWSEELLFEVEQVPANVAELLANLGQSSDGKFEDIKTLGDLYRFGEANKGFTVVTGIGKSTDSLLQEVLLGRLEADENENSNE